MTLNAQMRSTTVSSRSLQSYTDATPRDGSATLTWVNQWRKHNMFAGVDGKGAMDEWWETSLGLEIRDLIGTDFTTGPIDIARCFDQISRRLLDQLCKKANLDLGFLDVHTRYQEYRKVHNTILGGIGKAHTKEFGVSRGDH